MPARSALIRNAATAALIALALFACSSDSDSDSAASDGTSTGDEQPAPDPQDEAEPAEPDGGATDLPRIEVDDTFTVNASGVFEGTYLGLADLGLAPTNGNGQVRCYAVLAELTNVEASEFGGTDVSPQNELVLGADGAEVGTFETLGCPESPVSENGYTSVFSVDWAPGVTELVAMDLIAMPEGDEDLMDRVQLYPNSAEFELAATVTETFSAG